MNYVSVSGYGWSGSSAYVSLLKEFGGFFSIDKEFRLIKDPFGLLDLESSLVDNWEFIRHDVAIRDYLWFCQILSRNSSLFSAYGSSYNNLLSIDFVKESNDYIDRLTNFSYIGDSVVHRYRLNPMQYFYRRISSKVGLYNNTGTMKVSRPTEKMFVHETRKYLNNIFKNYKIQYNAKCIVLDQAIPVSNIMKSSRYFSSIKTIVVDRDPRDIYVSLVKRRKLLGFELHNKDSVDKYIDWHKILRENAKDNLTNKDVLYVNFEDLVLDYSSTISKVKKFIGEKESNHIYPGKYFDNNKAANNVGLWKNYHNQSVMDKIYEALKDDCIKCEF